MSLSDARTISKELQKGIAAAIAMLPIALVFGMISGMGAKAGIYGAISIGLVSVIFGGSTMVSRPTVLMAVLSSIIIAFAIERSISMEAGMTTALLTFLVAGVFQLLFGLFQFGGKIKYVPYAAFSILFSALGVVIILSQIYLIFGYPGLGRVDGFFYGFAMEGLNGYSIALVSLTVAIIYLFPKLTKSISSPLIAMIIVSLISHTLDFDVQKIGALDQEIPSLNPETLGDLNGQTMAYTLVPAFILAAFGVISTTLTSQIAGKISGTKCKVNREIAAQGLGNMVAAFFGGMPVAGAAMPAIRTIRWGATTRLSGLVYGIVLMLIFMALGKYVSEIPLAVVTGILLTTGINCIDFRKIRELFVSAKNEYDMDKDLLNFKIKYTIIEGEIKKEIINI